MKLMKLTKQQKLFRDLQDKINEELYSLVDNECNKLFKQHKKSRDQFLNEVGRVLLKFDTENNVLNLTEVDKVKLYTSLGKEVKSIFKLQRKEEVKIIQEFFINIAEDKYYTNSYLLNLGLDFSIKKVSNKVLDSIINTKVKNELWSDRLWKNKKDIEAVLKSEVKKFVDGEINLNSIEKILKQIFNQNAYNTKRLVQTESARVMEEANNMWQEENNIEWVMYSATLDNATCSDCGDYDGEVYKVSEKPFELPQHPFCRCTYVSVVNKEWKPNTRLNNVTKENISYKTYKEWKEENNI